MTIHMPVTMIQEPSSVYMYVHWHDHTRTSVGVPVDAAATRDFKLVTGSNYTSYWQQLYRSASLSAALPVTE